MLTLEEKRVRKRAYDLKYRSKNRQKLIAKTEEWRDRNRGKVNANSRKSYANNREAHLTRQKRWRQQNPETYKRSQRAHIRQLKVATPTWVDLEAINAVYREAKEKGLAVDHIIPITNEQVCGLHVPWNLQLLTKQENSRKYNHFEEPNHEP
jgi:5-methylcytosine-specific restriction endonuclease McrA